MYLWLPHKAKLSKSIKYKDSKVVYSQSGSGEVVVLLHGFLEDKSMWQEYVQALDKRFRVICIDLLGQGESESIGYVHSMWEHAQAVKAVLISNNVKNCTVVGHSMGGYIALELAHESPELINGLVLFHSTAYPDSEARKADRERIIRLVGRGKSAYIKTVIPSLFAKKSTTKMDARIKNLIKIAEGFSKQGIIANIRGMMERPSRDDVLQFAAFPKLLIHGELDPVIDLEDLQKQTSLNGNISLKTVNGIGHMGHMEAPEKCLRLITDFCGA